MRPLRLMSVASALVLGASMAFAPGLAGPAAAVAMSVEHDKDNYAREMTLIFHGITDPAGTRTVWISCNGGADRSGAYPFAARLLVSLDLPGCEGYGLKTVDVQVEEADHTPLFWGQVTPGIAPRMTLLRPLPAITGHSFTFDPEYPADYDLPAGSICRWEFRWGNDRSLNNDYDETFGALGFDTRQVGGDCPTWTFTLPWVPFRQFELYLSVGIPESNGEIAFSGGAHVRFDAAEDGTGRRITASNLPIAQVLPSTYTPIVGQPVTYTRYLIGGATAGTSVWDAHQGAGDHPNHWTQEGGSTFTIRPWEPGNLTVGWQRMSGLFFYAMYDPPVRYRDHVRPNTTAPVQHVGSGAVGATVPVKLTWTGSDVGWGIRTYQLERSIDGGAWRRILNAKVRSLAQSLAPGHGYRYRVRAVDKYGNHGSWDVGPTFRPRVAGDGAPAITYSAAWAPAVDATARGGSLHESSVPGSTARFTFTGRDVAWIAERGPGHGKAKVYVDGKLVTTVDLAAASDAPARVVFRKHWTTKATHRVRVVVEGTVARPVVDVDGFVVLR